MRGTRRRGIGATTYFDIGSSTYFWPRRGTNNTKLISKAFSLWLKFRLVCKREGKQRVFADEAEFRADV